MKSQVVNSIIDFTAKAEGFSSTPYICPAGYRTIGYGRNLDAKPLDIDEISEDDAWSLLESDLEEVYDQLDRKFSWFSSCELYVQAVLLDMTFNMGIGDISKFKNMLAACEAHDDAKMIAEMKDSKWYEQVGNRSKGLILRIENKLV